MSKKTEEISFLLPVREFPDKGTKWLLEFSENVKGLLHIVGRDLANRLDFSRLERVNRTFIPDNLREQESDVVYVVPFRGEGVGEVWVYVLIEHQSTASQVMGFRVLFYMVQIWDAQRREWEDKKVPQSQWRFRPPCASLSHCVVHRQRSLGVPDCHGGADGPPGGVAAICPIV